MSDAPSGQARTVVVPAARYARLVNTLRGDVPTIHTVAILTTVLDDHDVDPQVVGVEDIRRNADLGIDLAAYSVRQIKGRFGSLVNPYVVSNLPRTRVVELGVKYGQDGVIFGYRKGGKKLGMGFEWICTRAARGTVGHVEATRRMLLQPHVPGEGRDHLDGEVHLEFAIVCKGVTFELPFFDKDPAREEDFRGGRVLTYRSTDIPAHAKPALDAYLTAETQLNDALRAGDRTGHSLYIRRGVVGNTRVALFEAMGDWQPFPLVWERQW